MRTLWILRGAPASGKSSWIKDHCLQNYTLSSDDLRLLVQSPATTLDGKPTITSKNDTQVWKLLYNLLEDKMRRGEFVIVDATHYTNKSMYKYKDLISKYRYRAYYIDFSEGLSLEEHLERNRKREYLKQVPDEVIIKMYNQLQNQEPPSSTFKKLTPEEAGYMASIYNNEYNNLKIDLTNDYDDIVVFGDIHGCYNPIKDYFDKHSYNEKTCYYSLGDLLDRGLQNKEVLEWVCDMLTRKNFFVIEGNHECVHKDTDILTNKGWLNIEDIVENKIDCRPYTYNIQNNKIELDNILEYHKKYQEDMIHIRTNNTEQIVSLNHDVLINDTKIKAKDLYDNKSKYIQSLHKNIKPCGLVEYNDYDISDDWLKLLVWVVTDGCLVDANKNKNGYAPKLRVQFKLSKERKIKELTNLLNNMNIKYSIKTATKSGGNILQPYLIRIYGDDCRKIFSYFPNGKIFPNFFKNLSYRQTKIVIKTISITDGHPRHKRIDYYSSNILNDNIISEMCIKNNYCFTMEYIHKSGFDSNKLRYIYRITQNWNWIKKLNNIEKIKYNDYSYCLTTNNGTLITRINGKVAFTGNCHIRRYVNNEVGNASQEFRERTIPQIKDVDIKKVKELSNRLLQMAWFKFGDKEYLLTHGGIPCLPNIRMATSEMINGVGQYGDVEKIYKAWDKNTDNTVQLHGHRNLTMLPAKISDYMYNLNDAIEWGGYLRVATIHKDGKIDVELFKNDIFKDRARKPSTEAVFHSDNEFIQRLNDSPLVAKKCLKDGVVSFNFTRDAFNDSRWNELTVKARGLFIDSQTDDIVARGFVKFFEVNSVKETTIPELKKNLHFPVKAYYKENGFLGLISWHKRLDKLFIASKSTNEGPFADMVRDAFFSLPLVKQNILINFMIDNDCTLLFEVVEPEKDPHIIKYNQREFILLAGIKNKLEDEYIPYNNLVSLIGECKKADDEGILSIKLIYDVFDNWEEFFNFYTKVEQDYTIEHEGWVFEDANNFMLKFKTPFYKFWKQMRSVKDRIMNEKEVKHTGNPIADDVIDYMVNILGVEGVRNCMSIIDVREKWLEYKKISQLH